MRFFPFTNTSHLPSSFVFPNSHVGSRVNEENGSLGSAPLRPPPASGLPQAEQNNRSVPLPHPSSLLSLEKRFSNCWALPSGKQSGGTTAPLSPSTGGDLPDQTPKGACEAETRALPRQRPPLCLLPQFCGDRQSLASRQMELEGLPQHTPLRMETFCLF